MMDIMNDPDHRGWVELYKKLIYWELELDKAGNNEMSEVMEMQKVEANKEFFKFIQKNYISWLQNPGKDSTPTLSHTLFANKVLPLLRDDVPTFFLLIDNLRYDQWKMIEPMMNELFRKVSEDHLYSILPATTQYSRNAIFAGMMPAEIEKKYPGKWFNDEEEEGKNLFEDFSWASN